MLTRMCFDLALPRVQAGRAFGLLGQAHICEGSVIKATVVGWTPQHAVARAQRRLPSPAPAQIVAR
jgi:hypothetical protein